MPKPKLPADPKDYYVHAEEKVSLPKLAELYQGKKFCTLANLRQRSKAEKWPALREQKSIEIRSKVDQKLIENRVEKQLSDLAQLNQNHNQICKDLFEAAKVTLQTYLQSGFKPQDLEAITRTNLHLIRTQRLIHNIDPEKPDSKLNQNPEDDILAELMADVQDEGPFAHGID